MSAIVIIPARYESARFPGKPLALLKGEPLIRHVYENSSRSRLASGVIVATDCKAIFDAVFSFGGRAVMTASSHASGTDRIAEASASIDCDIIVNVQGDEPLIRAEMIDDVIALLEDESASMGTLVRKIERPEDISDPNVVKAAFGADGFALYFSRAPIPYHRDEWKRPEAAFIKGAGFSVYKHIGIYSYRKEALLKLSRLPVSRLESIEKLEQLRALEAGIRIKTKETLFDTIGVDTPEDLERVERCLSTSL